MMLLHGVLVGFFVGGAVEDLVAGWARDRDVVLVPHVPCNGLPQLRLVPRFALEPLVASFAAHVVCLD